MMVYPVPGRRVRDPVTNHVLTDEGLEVSEHDLFWARRLRDEDVTTTAPVAEKVEAPAEEKNETPAAAAEHQPAEEATHAGGEQA